VIAGLEWTKRRDIFVEHHSVDGARELSSLGADEVVNDLIDINAVVGLLTGDLYIGIRGRSTLFEHCSHGP